MSLSSSSSSSSWPSLLLLLIILLFLNSSSPVCPLSPDEPSADYRQTPPPSGGRAPLAHPSPSPEQHPALHRRPSPFHPTMAVIVGLLTTMFSATFLFLLYAKHCKRGSGYSYSGNPYPTLYPTGASTAGRKNSGIDRAVIESLPVFRFQSLSGHKDGLECAVCLAKFEPAEVLRLLPKCKHAFHVECVDTWLDAHSTCPLCRYRVDPEDVLLVDHQLITKSTQNHILEIGEGTSKPEVRRVSGRHSSAGERGQFLQFLQHKRRSLDLKTKKSESSMSLRCFNSNLRKDGLLLTDHRRSNQPAVENEHRRTSAEERRRRLEHRIVISAGDKQRWSNVEPSDLLYLRSEMILINSGRRIGGSGKNVINSRSMSEITGLSRFQTVGGDVRDRDRDSRYSTSHSNDTIINSDHEQERQKQWQRLQGRQ